MWNHFFSNWKATSINIAAWLKPQVLLLEPEYCWNYFFTVYTCNQGSSTHCQVIRSLDLCFVSHRGRREVPVCLCVLQCLHWNAPWEPWLRRVCLTATFKLNKMQQTERRKLWKGGNKMFQRSVFLIKNDICSTGKKVSFFRWWCMTNPGSLR